MTDVIDDECFQGRLKEVFEVIIMIDMRSHHVNFRCSYCGTSIPITVNTRNMTTK